MPDATEFAEGDYVTVKLIESSPTKIGVILEKPIPKETQYGRRLKTKIQIDHKIKSWTMNPGTVQNLMDGYGKDYDGWASKKIRFTVESEKGKDFVKAYAVPEDMEKAEQVDMSEPTPVFFECADCGNIKKGDNGKKPAACECKGKKGWKIAK